MSTAAQEVKQLKKEISSLKNMLADQIEDSAPNGLSKSLFSREDIAEMANNAGKSARQFFETKQEQALRGKEYTENLIQDRPFVSAATAFAAGVLLTSLFRNK